MGPDRLSLDGEAVMTQVSHCHDHIRKKKTQGTCWKQIRQQHTAAQVVSGPHWTLLHSAYQQLFIDLLSVARGVGCAVRRSPQAFLCFAS